MTTTAFEHGTPWTDEEYLALGATSDRVEFFDGSLHVTPGPTAGHQTIARRVANALDGPGERAGLETYEALNVRLRRARLPIPDVVLCRPLAPHEHVAEAGIPWYLLIDPDVDGVLVLTEPVQVEIAAASLVRGARRE
jgi:Uma2 family endonuclease